MLTSLFLAGITLIFLPPYSPDIPSKKRPAFSRGGGCRREYRRFGGAVESSWRGLMAGMAEITTEKALAWIKHAGYGFIE
jgi:hypothetical protein